jgi:hypothetical protein
MRTAKDRRDAHHQLICEAKAQRAGELRQAAQHVHDMARERGFSMLILVGLTLLGGYALHAATSHAGGPPSPVVTQSR